jgi:hypothetical protein
MINPVSNGSQTHAAVQPSAARQSAPQAKAQPQPAATDTVQLSSAKALLQETLETPAQTAREARSGDLQAKRLLAREAADKAAG